MEKKNESILTERRQEMLNFIREFNRKNGYSPLLSEIAERFKITEPAVHRHIHQLEAAGAVEIVQTPGRKKSIRAIRVLWPRQKGKLPTRIGGTAR